MAVTVRSVPMVRVEHSVAQSIANNTLTTLSFDTEIFDTDGMHVGGANDDRLTAKTAGIYLITFAVEWESNGAGSRFVGVRENGAALIFRDRRTAISATESTTVGLHKMAVDDFVTVDVLQTSGGALDVSSNTTSFNMFYIGVGTP